MHVDASSSAASAMSLAAMHWLLHWLLQCIGCCILFLLYFYQHAVQLAKATEGFMRQPHAAHAYVCCSTGDL
jgi:hypothetical protein